MAAPKYLSEQDYYQRMTDFTGYIGHLNNQTKAELRNEIILSEERVKTELRAEIIASEARVKTELRAEIAASEARVKTELRAEIAASEARVMQKIDAVTADVATLKSDVASLKEGQEKLTKEVSELRTHTLEVHKMLQLVLDQMSVMRAERRRD